uniref:RING-type domain-containing protein n=1 Tax=Poecilia mexicana TaxID=48701 RepID=A0A3B3XLP3_9TELE
MDSASPVLVIMKKTFSCSVCLDLLKDPVTTSCGHSYCMNCIKNFWDNGEEKSYNCPQCKVTFTQRPVIKENTINLQVLNAVHFASQCHRECSVNVYGQHSPDLKKKKIYSTQHVCIKETL